MKLSVPVSDPAVSQSTVSIIGLKLLSHGCTNTYYAIMFYLYFYFLSPEKFFKLRIFSMYIRSPLTCNQRKMKLDVLWTNISQKSLT